MRLTRIDNAQGQERPNAWKCMRPLLAPLAAASLLAPLPAIAETAAKQPDKAAVVAADSSQRRKEFAVDIVGDIVFGAGFAIVMLALQTRLMRHTPARPERRGFPGAFGA
ncbi:MAG: hypothetical protein PHV13_04965 [Candidatus ainarchaeum sp.]|nr:hypothetical protein [Candidatus ainarchaeum sp.]